MLSTYTIWDQLWSALVTTLAKIVWTLLKAENRHTSQNFETLLGVRARGLCCCCPLPSSGYSYASSPVSPWPLCSHISGYI